MLAGRMMPCQWIEVSCASRLRTRNVTVSPSRQRSSGPGRLLLTVSAVRGRPVMLTGVWPMNSSKCWPARSRPSAAWASGRHSPRPASVLAAPRPLTNVRREGLRNMAWPHAEEPRCSLPPAVR
ncbi:hypothetical protein D3C76_882400 [compost metagenome]